MASGCGAALQTHHAAGNNHAEGQKPALFQIRIGRQGLLFRGGRGLLFRDGVIDDNFLDALIRSHDLR